jgi:hypothetical protein
MAPRVRLGLLLPLISVLAAASLPAAAKDICIQDGVIFLHFKRVKPLKKPGSVAPLHGFYTNGSQTSSITGTALTRADGSVSIGVYVHAGGVAAASTEVDFTFNMTGDPDFNATGSYRYLDGPTFGSASSWTPVSCRTLEVP